MKWTKQLGVFLPFLFFVFLCTTILTFRVLGLRICIVQGHSMDPTLVSGERLLLNPSTEPEFGDIAVFRYGDGYIVKRVIGLPGDEVEAQEGELTVNGTAYREDYLDPSLCRKFPDASFDVFVGEGEYFVLGDNRDNSRDSRVFGCLPEDAYLGVAIFHF